MNLIEQGGKIYVVSTIRYPARLREAAAEKGINLSECFREALVNKIAEIEERAGDTAPTTPRNAVTRCHTIASEDK